MLIIPKGKLYLSKGLYWGGLLVAIAGLFADLGLITVVALIVGLIGAGHEAGQEHQPSQKQAEQLCQFGFHVKPPLCNKTPSHRGSRPKGLSSVIFHKHEGVILGNL